MVSPPPRRERLRQTRRARDARDRLAVFWIIFPATVFAVVVVGFVLRAVL